MDPRFEDQYIINEEVKLNTRRVEAGFAISRDMGILMARGKAVCYTSHLEFIQFIICPLMVDQVFGIVVFPRLELGLKGSKWQKKEVFKFESSFRKL